MAWTQIGPGLTTLLLKEKAKNGLYGRRAHERPNLLLPQQALQDLGEGNDD